MKKYIAPVLALMIVLSLLACRRQPSTLSEYYATDTPVASAVPTSTPSPLPGTIHSGTDDSSIDDDTIASSSVAATLPLPNTNIMPATTAPVTVVPPSPSPKNDVTPSSTDNAAVPTESPEPTTAPVVGHVPNSTAYEQYNSMSGVDQIAFMNSFDSIEAFFAWLNAAQADYEATNPAIEITGETVILGP